VAARPITKNQISYYPILNLIIQNFTNKVKFSQNFHKKINNNLKKSENSSIIYIESKEREIKMIPFPRRTRSRRFNNHHLVYTRDIGTNNLISSENSAIIYIESERSDLLLET